MRTVQQGSERSQLLARPCVGDKVQAASVPHSVLMELSTVECVGESMATSTTPDAFYNYIANGESIDSAFVDGIVLTHGSPRQHIWTFATGYNQYRTDDLGCPCNSDSYSYSLPPYVGNDYFCDSGHRYTTSPPQTYLTNDPLWDGAGCVSGSCCTFNSPPWFCKTLPHHTTDNIELCICMSYHLSDEDVAFELVDLYVQ